MPAGLSVTLVHFLCLATCLTALPGQLKKEEKLWPENFTRILDRLLDGYDNRLRPGFGGQEPRPGHFGPCPIKHSTTFIEEEGRKFGHLCQTYTALRDPTAATGQVLGQFLDPSDAAAFTEKTKRLPVVSHIPDPRARSSMLGENLGVACLDPATLGAAAAWHAVKGGVQLLARLPLY
uniref:Uncharacterized protein n=1 Tax=Sphaerodactylus townsendi TaxID=933632 RepID=A0ACB8E760_9SAUR